MTPVNTASITSLSEHKHKPQPSNPPYISVLIPFYNEEEVLETCHERVIALLNTLPHSCEIVYINDGSTDTSWDIAQSFQSKHHIIRCINLSRNFGKEAAMTAGLAHTTGQAVVLLDADLQDPPELIPAMIDEWQAGFDVVNMQRKERHGESWFKRMTASLFYKVINRLSDIDMPKNVGDFRLLDRRVIDIINALPERNRFMKGLLSWPGFKTTTLQFDRDARQAGITKWNYTKLVHLAFEGITSFSIRPLRIATAAGLFASMAAVVMAIVVMSKTMLWGDPVAGFPSLMTVLLLLGGIQLLSIGLLGEYVGRLFIESKQRPNFIVMDNMTNTPDDQNNINFKQGQR